MHGGTKVWRLRYRSADPAIVQAFLQNWCWKALEKNMIPAVGNKQIADVLDRLLWTIDQSSMKRAHKLAQHLLILRMVHKFELIEARWEEIDFEKDEWLIPGERMKKDKPHFAPLPRQAVATYTNR